MPFTKFLATSGTLPPDLGGALTISGFRVLNEVSSRPHQEPFRFTSSLPFFQSGSGTGIDYDSINVASGQFFSKEPAVTWSLIDPSTNQIVPPNELSTFQAFRGFEVSLRTETGRLVRQYESGDYKKNYYTLSVDEVIQDFRGLPVAVDSAAKRYLPGDTPRRVALHVISTDYYGRKNTGISFLTSPEPRISDVKFAVSDYVTIIPTLTKTSGINAINVYLGAQEGFEILFTGVSGTYYNFHEKFTFDETDTSFEMSLSPPLESGYFYALNVEDNYGTGTTYYAPSSIKPFTIDPLMYNPKPSGFDGKVVVNHDTINKNVDTVFVGKLMREMGVASHTVNIIESGNIHGRTESFAVNTPSIENVTQIVHGTGTTRIDKRMFSVNSTMQDFAYSGAAATSNFFCLRSSRASYWFTMVRSYFNIR